eukprot:s1362_g25.t1
MACLQETRTDEGCRVTDHFQIYSSGKQVCGQTFHFGCEIWVHKFRPIGYSPDGHPIRLSDFKAVVVCKDPRLLVLKLSGPFTIVLVSAHAPCMASYRALDDIRAWWDKLTSTVQPFLHDSWIIFGIDANAPLGSDELPGIGTYAAEETSETGRLFADFILQSALHVPATFSSHEGATKTWRHPRGQWLRRDYLLVGRSICSAVATSFALSDFDGGFEHEDHLPMAIRMAGSVRLQPGTQKFKWDFDKLSDPDCQKEFQLALSSLPIPVWNFGVDAHARIFEGQLMQLAQQCFSGGYGRKRHRPVLTEPTLNLIAFKRQVLQFLRTHGDDHVGSIMTHIRAIDKEVRPRVANDQKAWYDNWLQEIQASGAIHDHRSVFAKLARLGRKKKTHASGARPLPILQHPDGHYATDFDESQRIFCDQFARIEAGLEVSDHQLMQLHRPHALAGSFDPALCPSVFEVSKRIKQMKNGKVPGPGGLPIEVLKAGGSVVAKHLVPLLMKAVLHQQEPLHWKGGTLIPLFKGKGSTTDAGSYRSIFLSDCIAKIHHGHMRQCLASSWMAHQDVIQYGGKKGFSTDLAHHLLGMHMAWGRQKHLSVGLLFVDLQAAF